MPWNLSPDLRCQAAMSRIRVRVTGFDGTLRAPRVPPGVVWKLIASPSLAPMLAMALGPRGLSASGVPGLRGRRAAERRAVDIPEFGDAVGELPAARGALV